MTISDRESEFLMFYMKETSEEMRHVEELRATVSSLIIALATLIVGFIVQQNFKQGTGILAFFMIGLGLFGAIMTRKLYQLHQSGQERLDHWYEYIEKNIPDSEVLKRRDMADAVHKQKFHTLPKIRHNYFWIVLHLLITVFGVAMLVLGLI